MEIDLKDGMCRCCASEGSYKDFTASYRWMGVEEVYADMLKDCFDITLSISTTVNNGGICEVCITQLRNAFNFKKQVQNTEEQFKKMQDNIVKMDVIKVEMPQDDLENSDNGDNNIDDDFSSPEYDVPIKTIKLEKAEEAKAKKRLARASASKAKKAKAEAGESSAKRTVWPTKKVFIKNPRPPGLKKEIKIIPREVPTVNIFMKKKIEMDKHLENIRTILVNSNATPIRCRGGFSYTCWFCPNQYQIPNELKKHTIEAHDNAVKEIFMKGASIINYVVKLDITDLRCNLCNKDIPELEDFTNHLSMDHGKKYNNDVKSHIVPFRFNDNDFRCVTCKNKFNNFKVLIEHMSAHYSNYVCNICGAGFINKRTLQTHGYRHKTGTFNCSFCPKVFDTSIKKRDHERGVHILRNKRSKCGYCGEKFTDYTKKNDHLVKIHGATPIVLQCQACDKTFGNQRSLTMHTKSYHLLQRKKPDKTA